MPHIFPCVLKKDSVSLGLHPSASFLHALTSARQFQRRRQLRGAPDGERRPHGIGPPLTSDS